jgi:hypothetical protein
MSVSGVRWPTATLSMVGRGWTRLMLQAVGADACTSIVSEHGGMARPLTRALHTMTPARVATKLQV